MTAPSPTTFSGQDYALLTQGAFCPLDRPKTSAQSSRCVRAMCENHEYWDAAVLDAQRFRSPLTYAVEERSGPNGPGGNCLGFMEKGHVWAAARDPPDLSQPTQGAPHFVPQSLAGSGAHKQASARKPSHYPPNVGRANTRDRGE